MHKHKNQLRIIGGMHRSRRLDFPDVEGLRPTGDRIRETLFNWLGPHMEGASCLDLFAGSGALGFEALSRGAQHVVFVDRSPLACDSLRHNLSRLSASNASIHQTDGLAWLPRSELSFDVVFLDPPFNSDLLSAACDALEKSRCLKPGAFIYLEQPKESSDISVPDHWQLYRDKSSGQVRYRLYSRP